MNASAVRQCEHSFRRRGGLTVYGLLDPRDARIRYVGATGCPSERVPNHVSCARGGHKMNPGLRAWLLELDALLLRPQLMAFAVGVSAKEAAELERHWIAKLPGLLNVAPGGDGLGRRKPGPPISKAERAMRSEVARATWARRKQREAAIAAKEAQ